MCFGGVVGFGCIILLYFNRCLLFCFICVVIHGGCGFVCCGLLDFGLGGVVYAFSLYGWFRVFS